jgi:hypothetical protein
MDASAAVSAGLPSTISKQKDAFLSACGVSVKGLKKGSHGAATAVDDDTLVADVLPFVKAQLANDKFDFGTMFSSIQAQARSTRSC